MISLFKQYPQLEEDLPYVSLGELLTPVERLNCLGKEIKMNHLYIKRDDISGGIYGGNKLRKLEFLLGDALGSGIQEILTFGYAGSNHALATSIYSQRLGLKSISMLLPQPNAYYVRHNLLLGHYYGAELYHYQNVLSLFIHLIYQVIWRKIKYGRFPRLIMPGGSSPLGTIGYVNAAFELKKQIIKGELPEPDVIYIALGSMGTAAGLILGLKAVNLKSQVIAIRVIDKMFVTEKRIISLIRKTNSLLHSRDRTFPMIKISRKDVKIRHDFFGNGYAHFTEKGMRAVKLMERTEGIKLDGTYTGKTLAALIEDIDKQELRDKVILFWNTYNSRDFSDIKASVDYHDLPECFYRYFEKGVQPLDLP